MWYYELCVTLVCKVCVYIHIPYITTLYRYGIDMIYNRNSNNW